jgi:WD40 repeat protein
MKTLKVSSAALLFVVVAGDRLITVDANRLVGYHMGWQFLSPDMIPPFKVKVDDLAYDLSIGKADNKRTYVPDRVLGVPFVSFDSTAAAKIANMKPLTAAQYVKYDAQPRRHLAYEQDEPAAVVKRPAEETTSPQESMDAGGAREKLKRMLTFKSFKGSVSLKGSVSFKGSVGEEATELSESISNPSSDRSARQLSTDVKSANSRGAPDRSLNSQLFVHVPEGKVIFSGGHWDKSLRATSTENGRLIQKIVPHSDVITCVAYGQDFGRRWLVTGSRDCTVMVWSLGKELKLEPKPMHILCAHDDTVNVVAVCPELDIIASGADDGTIVIHALHSGAYVRSIVVGNALAELNDLTLMAAQSQQSAAPSSPNSAPVGQKTGSSDNQGAALLQQQQKATIACKVNWLGISKEGFIVAYSGDEQALVSYTLNGVYLAAKYVPERLYALTISDDGLVLLSGGDACLVVLRWIRSLTLANDGPRSGLEAVIEGSSDVSPKSPPFEAPIRSLYLTKNEHLLLVGLENGEVRALAQDSDYLRQRLQKKLLEIGIL